MSGVYVFKGNPYEQTDALGVGNLDLSKDGDGVPIHTKGLSWLLFILVPSQS